MLGAQGIITPEEADTLIAGLEGILSDIDTGVLAIDLSCEDIHTLNSGAGAEQRGGACRAPYTGAKERSN